MNVPRKINMEPENHLFERGKHFRNHHFQVQAVNLWGCFVIFPSGSRRPPHEPRMAVHSQCPQIARLLEAVVPKYVSVQKRQIEESDMIFFYPIPSMYGLYLPYTFTYNKHLPNIGK